MDNKTILTDQEYAVLKAQIAAHIWIHYVDKHDVMSQVDELLELCGLTCSERQKPSGSLAIEGKGVAVKLAQAPKELDGKEL